MRTRRPAFLAALLPSLALAMPGAGVQAIEAEGTSFKATLADGRVLGSAELVGAVLVVATGGGVVRVRIDAVERDPRDARIEAEPGDAVWLHRLSRQAADGSWSNLCSAGPDGRTQGFPLAGKAAADGTLRAAAPGVFELVCTAGAQGKCVRFGYHPWSTTADGAALRDAFNACVRMLRGDYAGDNSPKTDNGVMIDAFDRWGIQNPDGDEAMHFEAGWSPEGAVCVHHPRVSANVSLAELEAQIPRLAGRTGAICTEAFARVHGALVFNRSKP